MDSGGRIAHEGGWLKCGDPTNREKKARGQERTSDFSSPRNRHVFNSRQKIGFLGLRPLGHSGGVDKVISTVSGVRAPPRVSRRLRTELCLVDPRSLLDNHEIMA